MRQGTSSPVDQQADMLIDIDQRLGSIERVGHIHTVSYLPLSGGAISGNLSISGTLGVTGATTTAALAVVGTLNVSGLATLASASISGTLGVTGVATFSSQLNMTNGFTAAVLSSITTSSEALRLSNSAAYISWFNGGSREGYLQGNTSGMILNSEVGTLRLLGGTVSLEGALSINAATVSFSNANATLSASSYLIMPGGLYVSGGTCYVAGPLQARGGISNDSGSGAPGVRINGSGASYASGWPYMQLQVMETSGAQHSGLALYTGPTAPILRGYGPFGDRVDVLNNPNTAYCPIDASAFTVQSSERIKRDITETDDGALLATVASVKAHRFTDKVRPSTIPLTDRFMAANRRWVAAGHRPLTPKVAHYGGSAEPHDCADPRHNCLGAPGHPCPIAANDTPRFGLIAEHLHDAVPEAVFYGEDERPAGYDVDQIAALAFGGVGALMRELSRLTERLAAVESR